MKSLRVWILILAAVCYVAGLASGFWASRQVEGARQPSGPFADYGRLLTEQFDLSEREARDLRDILAHYQKDIDRIKDARMTDYMSAIEPDLREWGLRYRGYIRDHLIPHERRGEFDLLCEGRLIGNQAR